MHMNNNVKMPFALFILSILITLGFASWTLGAVFSSPHLDRTKNPGGCASCHGKQAKRISAANASDRSGLCFSCHSSSGLKGVTARHDMATVFNKRYRHPVAETGKYHRSNEELPEKNPGAPRHVACQDCHKVHDVTSQKPMAGIKGYTAGRARLAEARKEYEVCYNCHADSANMPINAKNKHLEFDRTNLSYHPVEAPGKNRRVPSLIRQLNIMSTIDCTDCHGNDEQYGPQGPHGSNYPAMLRYEYIKHETAEGRRAYELCYACHDRKSILNDESFRKHKIHIVYNHIPCSACHNPHGTDRNQHLIDFDQKFVGVLPLPAYIPSVDGRPMCLLKCHVQGRDYLHNNAFYSGKKWP